MLEIFTCINNEVKFITNNSLKKTYFPVWKPAEYQAFRTAVRSVSEPPICSSSESSFFLSELHKSKHISNECFICTQEYLRIW